MSQIIEKFGVGTALALGWPILSVACSHTITLHKLRVERDTFLYLSIGS